MIGYDKEFFQLKKPVAIVINIAGIYFGNQLIEPKTPSMRAFVIIGGAITGQYIYNYLGLGQADNLINNPVRGLAKAGEDVLEGEVIYSSMVRLD